MSFQRMFWNLNIAVAGVLFAYMTQPWEEVPVPFKARVVFALLLATHAGLSVYMSKKSEKKEANK